MKIKYVLTLPFNKCRSVYMTKHQECNNRRWLDRWIVDNNIVDVATVDFNNFFSPVRKYELVEFIINPNDLVSFNDVDTKIKLLSDFSSKFYFIAVNKFPLYTDADNCHESAEPDFDQKLILHWKQLPGFKLSFSSSNSSDRGDLGNSLYPITQLALERV